MADYITQESFDEIHECAGLMGTLWWHSRYGRGVNGQSGCH